MQSTPAISLSAFQHLPHVMNTAVTPNTFPTTDLHLFFQFSKKRLWISHIHFLAVLSFYNKHNTFLYIIGSNPLSVKKKKKIRMKKTLKPITLFSHTFHIYFLSFRRSAPTWPCCPWGSAVVAAPRHVLSLRLVKGPPRPSPLPTAPSCPPCCCLSSSSWALHGTSRLLNSLMLGTHNLSPATHTQTYHWDFLHTDVPQQRLK